MADHHIKDADFSEQVTKAAASVPTKITQEGKKGRRDLSQENFDIFTLGDANQGNMKMAQILCRVWTNTVNNRFWLRLLCHFG